jgi:diguanylate cyclase (GGDEF)-like protein
MCHVSRDSQCVSVNIKMTKSISIIQYLKQRIPQKYRLIAFLVTTSIIGVLLIFWAVYNTSKDLELNHEVDNLYRFAKASLDGKKRDDELLRALTEQSADDYQVLILEDTNITHLPDDNLHARLPLEMRHLEQSRINPRGGYVEIEDSIYTWAKLPVTGSNKHVVLLHKFVETPPSRLVNIYLKRLFVPAIFYVWLMVWVGLIIRFLTDKLVAQNKEFEQMALYDSLTGLPNRVLLDDRLKKLIQDYQRDQRTFALAVIDLNKFKAVNDNFGHDQGDELLCQVAERICSLLRTSDTASRIGGDEFVLLLNDVNEESCIHMCERIKSAVLTPYILREGEARIGLSIGIAMFPKHAKDPVTLMRNADMAMYSIKTNGGGIQFYAGSQACSENPVASVS